MIAGIILLDQIVKFAVRELMYVGESIPVIENVFHLTYVQNRGAAFSLFSGSGFMLIVLPVIALAVAVWYMAVSYTHLRAHETGRNLVCRLLLEKKKKSKK